MYTWAFSQPAPGCGVCPEPEEWVGFPGCTLRGPVDAHSQARRTVYLSPPRRSLPPLIVANTLLPCLRRPAVWEERGNTSIRPSTWRPQGGEDTLTSGQDWDGSEAPDTTSWGLRLRRSRPVSQCPSDVLHSMAVRHRPQKRWEAELCPPTSVTYPPFPSGHQKSLRTKYLCCQYPSLPFSTMPGTVYCLGYKCE